MFVLVLIYFFTFSVIIILKTKKHNKIYELPKLNFEQGKITFYSLKRHKINVGCCSMLILKKLVYLKRANKTLIVTNVVDAEIKNNFFYFTATGKVEIFLNNKKWCKYLQLNISSNEFDLTILKRNAELEIVNNLFNICVCKSFVRYIRFIRYVLNIDLSTDAIKVQQNKYYLCYCIDYDFAGIKKHIIFNQSV